ncbi:MAG: type II toxin-antitoxin system RelE/ParE family toxin [Beijerinckiaceae bacterium]
MKVRFTEAAVRDLMNLHAYVSHENPIAAGRLLDRIVDLAEMQLAAFPNSGRQGRSPNTRELVISGTPYIVAYRVLADEVQILAVIHGSRRWPENFE